MFKKKLPTRSLRFAEVEDIKKRRQRFIRLILCFVGIILFIGIAIYLFSLFRVKHIACKLDGENCENNLLQAVSLLKGRSMFSRLSLNHPFLQAKLRRVWPDSVMVTFAKPTLLVTFTRAAPQDPPVSLTVSGYLVPYLNGPKTPPIEDESTSQLPQNEKVSDSVLAFYTELTQSLLKFPNLPISRIKVVSEDEIHIFLDQGSAAIASQSSIARQLSSLQAILLSPTINREGKIIDLRFENPVLK